MKILITAAASCLWVTVLAADAVAATGDLTQKASPAACVSETGSGGGCSDGKALLGSASVAVAPDGENVYAASVESDAIAVFDRAPDGTLTQKPGTAGCISDTGSEGECANGVAMNGPRSVRISPDGETVYLTAFDSDAVAIFDRAGDGSLTQKPGTAGCVSETGSDGLCTDGKALDGASPLTVSPDGNNVYVGSVLGSDAIAIFVRAPDGRLTQKPGADGCIAEAGDGVTCTDGKALDEVRGIAVSPNGASTYASSGGTYNAIAAFDRDGEGDLIQKPGMQGCISEDGAGGVCGDGRALLGATGVAISPDGASVYVAAQSGAALANFDRSPDGTIAQDAGSTGCISETGSGGACTDGKILDGATGVTVSADGKSVYVGSLGPGGGPGSGIAILDRATDGTLTQDAGTAGCISETGDGGACVNGLALFNPGSVAISPDDRNVYSSAAFSNAVAVFDREGALPALSIDDVSIAEGNSGSANATLTVSLNAMAAADVTFNFETADGSATQPGDYTATSGAKTITAGSTSTTIDIPVNGDTLDEANESLFVNLSSPSTNAIVADGVGKVTVTDDDLTPSSPDLALTLKPKKRTADPGDRAKFKATVTNEGTAGAEGVKVCIKAPRGASAEVRANGCKDVGSLAGGDSARKRFKVKTTERADGKYRIRFTAKAANAERAVARAKLKVE